MGKTCVFSSANFWTITSGGIDFVNQPALWAQWLFHDFLGWLASLTKTSFCVRHKRGVDVSERCLVDSLRFEAWDAWLHEGDENCWWKRNPKTLGMYTKQTLSIEKVKKLPVYELVAIKRSTVLKNGSIMKVIWCSILVWPGVSWRLGRVDSKTTRRAATDVFLFWSG